MASLAQLALKRERTKLPLPTERVRSIVETDGPLMRQARTQGLQRAHSRGLLNSSLAAQSAQDAVVRHAVPLAQADSAAAIEARRLKDSREGSLLRLALDESKHGDDVRLRESDLAQRDRHHGAEMGFRRDSLQQQDRHHGAEIGVRKDSLAQQDRHHGAEMGYRRDSLAQQDRHHGAEIGVRKDSLAQQARQHGEEIAVRRETLGEQRRQHGEEISVRRESLAEQKRQHGVDVTVRREGLAHERDKLNAQVSHWSAELAEKKAFRIQQKEMQEYESGVRERIAALDRALRKDEIDSLQAHRLKSVELEEARNGIQKLRDENDKNLKEAELNQRKDQFEASEANRKELAALDEALKREKMKIDGKLALDANYNAQFQVVMSRDMTPAARERALKALKEQDERSQQAFDAILDGPSTYDEPAADEPAADEPAADEPRP